MMQTEITVHLQYLWVDRKYQLMTMSFRISEKYSFESHDGLILSEYPEIRAQNMEEDNSSLNERYKVSNTTYRSAGHISWFQC